MFRPGPFYLGKFWSLIVAWISIFFFETFVFILVMFSSSCHGITKSTMNYACVIGPDVWFLLWVYYMVYKKKYYRSPKTNLSDEQYEDEVGQNVIDQILSNQI